ncbi:MAG: Trk system potassium transporter TrkA [Treponema sp.]|nr:Trk system potassium transporter TrkA [Treponema sp.]
MKIVIVGAGFTGIHLAKLLINEKNDVALIDNNETTVRHVSNQLDCTVMLADGNDLNTLEEVGIAKANALVCVTESDEINMITCSLVDTVYPDVIKIARVRNYAYYVNTAATKKRHADFFSGKNRPLYGIDYMINPDVEAASAIVQAVENGAVSDVQTFAGSDYELTRMTIAEGSKLANQKLQTVRSLTDKHFLIAYVEEEGKTSLPSGDTILNPGDSIGVLVLKNDVNEMLALCGSAQKSLNSIALIGAGRIGTIIAEKLMQPKEKKSLRALFSRQLVKRPQTFVIIDNDEALTKKAAEKFPSANVFCADATDESFLQEEGIDKFDLAICATHNHEMNMVLAAFLESLGVGQSVSLVTSSAFSSIARKLGVDVSVPLRDAVVDSIVSHLRGKSVKEVHTITTGDLEIIECALPADSKAINKTLKDVSNPGVFLVLLLKKHDSSAYEIPVGDTVLNAGDHVVLITLAEENGKIVSFFGGSVK